MILVWQYDILKVISSLIFSINCTDEKVCDLIIGESQYLLILSQFLATKAAILENMGAPHGNFVKFKKSYLFVLFRS